MRRWAVVIGLLASSGAGIATHGMAEAVEGSAVGLTPGNLLLSSDDALVEVDGTGVVVGSLDVEYPNGRPGTESARDIAIGVDGTVHVFNGTFAPYLSSIDPVTGDWTHRTRDGWRIVNNASYGGVAVVGSRAFAHSNLGESGLIAFDLDTGESESFGTGIAAIDLSLGLDGLLYALSPSGSPGGRTVDVFDPATLALVRTIDLETIFGFTEHRSVAADADGDLYIADFDGEIHHVNAAGALVATIAPSCDWIGREIGCSFYDIDVAADGRVAVGSRFGEVILTDTSFSATSKFSLGRSGVFVEFIEASGPAEVDVDFLPRSRTNRVNLWPGGKRTVAILTGGGFDAATVDPTTVTIGPDGASPTGRYRLTDVDQDGDLDLRLRFDVYESGLDCGSTEVVVQGRTVAGGEFAGSDSVVPRHCGW